MSSLIVRCSNCGTNVPYDEGVTLFCEECGSPITIINPYASKSINNQPLQQSVQSQPVVQQPPVIQIQPVYVDNKPRGTDKLCLWGFILSIVSFLFCGMTSIFSLGLSIGGFFSVKKSNRSGIGLAICGIIFSSIGVLIILFAILYGISTGELTSGYSRESVRSSTTYSYVGR